MIFENEFTVREHQDRNRLQARTRLTAKKPTAGRARFTGAERYWRYVHIVSYIHTYTLYIHNERGRLVALPSCLTLLYCAVAIPTLLSHSLVFFSRLFYSLIFALHFGIIIIRIGIVYAQHTALFFHLVLWIFEFNK